MTTTRTDQFQFVRADDTYSGGTAWDVYTPAGRYLGVVAKSEGKRGSVWLAHSPYGVRVNGLRDRAAAARRLQEIAS